MASYTTEDLNNSSKFAEYNLNVKYITALYKKAPYIASYLAYTIRDATDEDFYVPSTLQGKCKILDVKLTEYLCNIKLTCNPAKERETCKPTDSASNYLIGTDSYGIQCQPSCFNLAKPQTYNDTTDSPTMPMLNWFKDNCRYVPSGVVSYLEKPFYRSKTIYEYRVNNLPTGFRRVPPDDQLFRKYDSGYSFKADDAYCSYFDREYDEENDNCKMTSWEEFVDAVLGMNVVSLAKDSINYLKSGGATIFDMPATTPLPPLDNIYTLNGWKTDINKDFVIPSELNYNEQTNVTLKGRCYSLPIMLKDPVRNSTAKTKHDIRRENESRIKRENKHQQSKPYRPLSSKSPSDIKPSTFLRPLLKNVTSVVAENTNTHAIYQLNRNLDLVDSLYSTVPIPDKLGESSEDFFQDLLNSIKLGGETIGNLVKDMLQAILTDPEMQKSLGIGIAFDKALSWVKTLSTKLLTSISETLIDLLAKEGLQVGAKVLEKSLFSTFVSICVKFAAKIASKLAIMLLNALLSAVDVIGWILEIGMLLNLILTFWDPFGLNKMFPAGYADEVMRQGEQGYKVDAGIHELNYTFQSLINTVMTSDEIMELQLESLIDRAIYLDALEVNSEGSRIDKGDTVDYSNAINSNTENQTLSESIVPIYKFDMTSYNAYNETFLTRIQTNQKLVNLSIILLGIPIVVLGFGFTLVSIVVLVLVALLLCWVKYGVYSQSDSFLLTLSNLV